MKKIVVGLAVLGLMVACASAGVGVSWSVSYGGYSHVATNVTGNNDALLDSYGVTWQLIYAGANDAADAVSLATGGANGDYVSGDDVVWGTRTLPQSIAHANVSASDGTVWSYWMQNVSGDMVYEDLGWTEVGTGYVYQRVFEGAPAELSWYFQTPLLALNTGYTGSPQFPQNFYLDTPSAGFKPNLQIPAAAVPEPATMGLLGLGALVMAIRRRRS